MKTLKVMVLFSSLLAIGSVIGSAKLNKDFAQLSSEKPVLERIGNIANVISASRFDENSFKELQYLRSKLSDENRKSAISDLIQAYSSENERLWNLRYENYRNVDSSIEASFNKQLADMKTWVRIFDSISLATILLTGLLLTAGFVQKKRASLIEDSMLNEAESKVSA